MGGVDADVGETGEGDGAVSFGQPPTLLVHDERYVHIGHCQEPKKLRYGNLWCRRGKEIIGSHHFFDALKGIVDHHRQVVRRGPVVAAKDDIVDQM